MCRFLQTEAAGLFGRHDTALVVGSLNTVKTVLLRSFQFVFVFPAVSFSVLVIAVVDCEESRIYEDIDRTETSSAAAASAAADSGFSSVSRGRKHPSTTTTTANNNNNNNINNSSSTGSAATAGLGSDVDSLGSGEFESFSSDIEEELEGDKTHSPT